MVDENEINALAAAIHAEKHVEMRARAARHKAEEKLATLLGRKDEGTIRRETTRWKVTTTHKLTRKLDVKKWDEIAGRFESCRVRPVTLKPTLDLKMFRALEYADPELYRLACYAIDAKPGKVAVEVEELNVN